MVRIQKRYSKQLSRNTFLCPKPMKKLNKAVERSSEAIHDWNGDKYGVTTTSGGHVLVVNLKSKTCECRKWDLTCTPCFHVMSCIFNQQQNLLQYVHKCYTREMYLKVYKHFVEPLVED